MSALLRPRRRAVQDRRSGRIATLALLGTTLAMASLMTPVVAHAKQATSLKMQVQSRRVVMGNNLILQLTARGDFDDLTPPTSDGFDFRQTGRSSQMSLIGARVTRSLVLTYQGVPRRPGKWRVNGAELKLRGKVIARTGSVQISVIDGRAALGPAIPPSDATALARYRGEMFFVRPVFSTMNPYLGQPLVVSYELYWVRGASVQGIRELTEPKFVGFEVEDLLKGQPQRQKQVRIGGRIFFRQVTRKLLVIASDAGKFEVFGPRYEVTVGDLFDSRKSKIGPPPVAIQVRPIPEEGRPKSYEEDAIGQLKLRAHLLERGQPTSSLTVKTGERTVLVYEVSGRGNLLSLPALRPPKLRGMTVTPLPHRADEAVTRTENGVEGKRAWRYLIAFDTPGVHDIPETTWSHFNPALRRFETTRVAGLRVNVKASPGDAVAAKTVAGQAAAGKLGAGKPAPDPATNGTQKPGAGGQPAKARAAPGNNNGEASTSAATAPAKTTGAPAAGALMLRDIAPTAGLANTAHEHFTDTRWFWPASGAPWAGALLLLGLWLLRRRRAQAAPDRAAQNALSDAVAALDAAKDHAELHAVTASYLQARADLRVAGMTSRSLRSALATIGVDEQTASNLITQLEHCDYARFAPGGGDDELRATKAQIAAALGEIDAVVTGSESATQAGQTSVDSRASAVLVILCAITSGIFAQTADAATLDQSFQAANAAFASDDLATARRGYEALLTHGLQAAAVHYNLGNVLTKMDHLGEAVGHYRQAQRLAPAEPLKSDIAHNLKRVRRRLGERARRNHRVLHVFDESPELDVALARAAPRQLLGITVLLTGTLALLFFGLALFNSGGAWARAAAATAVIVQVSAGGWLWHAQRVDREVRHAVVVQEDASLLPCSGDGERLDLPEGLEVRIERQRPDGRVETRLPNGRTGCVAGKSLVTIAEGRR